MAFTSFQRGALWAATGLCGVSAVCFAVNAGAVLLEHPGRSAELYGMATAAAIFAFIASQLRDKLREGAADDRTLPHNGDAASLPPARPDRTAAHVPAPDATAVRLERDCPFCAERILVAARICKHCRSDVSAA
jgi:hypothetical protein